MAAHSAATLSQSGLSANVSPGQGEWFTSSEQAYPVLTWGDTTRWG